MLSETSAKSEITSFVGNNKVKRVKVAVFSLKLKRLLEMTILRTNGEILVLNFLKVNGFEMKTKRNYDYEGRSVIDFNCFKKNN